VEPIRSHRLLSLDLLRGVAILLVLGRHLVEWPEARAGIVRDVLRVWRRGGWIGVDLFFVLSGFLVAGLIFREQQRRHGFQPGRFLVRRGFKIYPAFYACALVVLVVLMRQGYELHWRQLVGEFLFLQNYLGGFVGVTWTLAVEEHFYLLLTVLVMALIRRGGANPFAPLPHLYAGLAALVLALRLVSFDADDYRYERSLLPTHLRIDSLFFGAVLSYYHHFHGEALRSWFRKYRTNLVFGAACVLAYPFVYELVGDPFINTLGFTLFSWGFGVLLLACLYGIPERIRNPLARVPCRLLAFVGFYSYSIYLWHEQFYIWMPRLLLRYASLRLDVGLETALALSGAVLWGVLVATVIEVPLLRLRERWFPSRSGGEPAPARIARIPSEETGGVPSATR
jgi:peptidoglycan/LPS O-acetylase OafA/YrhL